MVRQKKQLIFLLAVALVWSCGGASYSRPVHFGWAELGKERSGIDMISYPAEDYDRVEALAMKYGDRFVGEAAEFPSIPEDEPDVPSFVARGKKFAVVTTEGAISLGVTGFGASPGAGETHWYVHLEGAKELDGRQGLALYDVPAPEGVKLRIAGQIDYSAPDVQDSLARVMARLSAATPEARRGLLDLVEVNEDSLAWTPGRFPRGATALVSLRAHIAGKMDEIEVFSALFLADDHANIIGFLVLPDVRLDWYEVQYLVDLDGDNIDEAIVASSYYEGSYLNYLEWKGDEPHFLTLTGDGA